MLEPYCCGTHSYIPLCPQINKLDLDAVAIQQMLSMEKSEIAKSIYLQGHNYYDYDKPKEFGFVSLNNMTNRHTIDFTDFDTWRLYDEYFGADFAHNLIIDAMDQTGRFEQTTGTQRALAVNIAISSMVSYMSALEALYFSVSRCDSDTTVAETAFDGAVALLVGSVEGQSQGGARSRSEASSSSQKHSIAGDQRVTL